MIGCNHDGIGLKGSLTIGVMFVRDLPYAMPADLGSMRDVRTEISSYEIKGWFTSFEMSGLPAMVWAKCLSHDNTQET